MDFQMSNYRTDIKTIRNLSIISKELIHKGWSSDKKFCIRTEDGSKYLLRISPNEKSTARKEQFHIQQQLADLGVNMCNPIDFGVCDEAVYMIQSWVNGEDAEEVIPQLKREEQYLLGVEAGAMLKLIHSIPEPKNLPSWDQRYSAKLDLKIEHYEKCPIKFSDDENIKHFIEANRHLIYNRPQTFQHGDFHIGNMMIEENHIVIIDFDRSDYGDPWEEFSNIVWSVQASPKFASGIIDGYFNGPVPLQFWKLLALYSCVRLLSALPWAIPFGETEINTMLKQAEDVLNWYGNLQNVIPNWYQK